MKRTTNGLETHHVVQVVQEKLVQYKHKRALASESGKAKLADKETGIWAASQL